jgi:hypothetical protein
VDIWEQRDVYARHYIYQVETFSLVWTVESVRRFANQLQ